MEHHSERLCQLLLLISIGALSLAVIAESERVLLQVDKGLAAGNARPNMVLEQADDTKDIQLQLTEKVSTGTSHSSCLNAIDKFACLEKQVPEVEDTGVVVIIPGLGEPARVELVERNIQWLGRQGVPFECYIFVYKSQAELPIDASRFEPCKLVGWRGGVWLHHVKYFPLNETTKPFVLHMLDSVEPQENTRLADMFQIMRANGLGHASPTFPTVQSAWTIMAQQQGFTVGRFVDFIELHANLFTREYFACVQDTVDKENSQGWGFDQLLPTACGGIALGSGLGSLGLLDAMNMVKRHRGSYDLEMARENYEAFRQKHPELNPGPYTCLGALSSP